MLKIPYGCVPCIELKLPPPRNIGLNDARKLYPNNGSDPEYRRGAHLACLRTLVNLRCAGWSSVNHFQIIEMGLGITFASSLVFLLWSLLYARKNPGSWATHRSNTHGAGVKHCWWQSLRSSSAFLVNSFGVSVTSNEWLGRHGLANTPFPPLNNTSWASIWELQHL